MTSDPLDPGLREELVTTALQARLKAIDARRVERRALDVAESRAFVIRQAEALVAEWLRTTSDPDPATLANQLATNLGTELLARYELLTPAELLTGILPVSDGLTVPVLPDRPQVPLNQIKEKAPFPGLFYSGGGIRTRDLRVMRPGGGRSPSTDRCCRIPGKTGDSGCQVSVVMP
jgi:hypothetical protein